MLKVCIQAALILLVMGCGRAHVHMELKHRLQDQEKEVQELQEETSALENRIELAKAEIENDQELKYRFSGPGQIPVQEQEKIDHEQAASGQFANPPRKQQRHSFCMSGLCRSF